MSAPKSSFLNANHIQRLLIFHQDLPRICGDVDEGASMDELTEHVLYFHDARKTTNPSSPNTTNNNSIDINSIINNSIDEDGEIHYAKEEIVHFCGLCTALYTFPQSLEENNEDQTTEVHLANATLIFCKLEGVVLAVVEISNGDPLAVQTSIQRCHDLFCLLRGGGILHRLSERVGLPKQKVQRKSFSSLIGNGRQRGRPNAKPNLLHAEDDEEEDDDMPPDISAVEDVGQFLSRNTSQSTEHSHQKEESVDVDDERWRIEDDGCIYPGMKLLYEFRKTERKQIRQIEKLSDFLQLKRKSMMDDLGGLQAAIRKLKKLLPITRLRRDLKVHYDDYIAEVGLIIKNRCIVEALPPPVVRGSDKDAIIHCSPSVVASARMGHRIEEILEDGLDKYEEDDPLLLGVSSFYHGHFIYTHLITRFPFAAESHLMGLQVTKKSACEILSYMVSFQEKVKQVERQKAQDPARVNTVLSPLKQLQTQYSQKGPGSKLSGTFLKAPPLSMLNIADKLCDVSDPVLGHIWTPVFHLPVEVPGDKTAFIEINAALFSVGNYSFLVYFDPGELEFDGDISEELSMFIQHEDLNYFMSESTSSIHVDVPKLMNEGESKRTRIGTMLERISSGLFSCLRNTEDREDPCIRSKKISNEPGLDIVFIDRSLEKVVIQLNENRSNGKNEGFVQQILNLGKRSEDNGEPEFRDVETDVRHQLAAELPPDILHAVDDAMNEMNKVSQQAESQPKIKAGSFLHKGYRHFQGDFEVCIYLAHGWVWAGIKGTRELYLIFDPKIFVTISDVEKTVVRLRGTFLNDPSN